VKLPPGYNGPSGRKRRASVQDWAKRGITNIDGSPLRSSFQAGLLLPAGKNGPAFLVGRNFDALYSYNAAESYGLAIAHLADRLATARARVDVAVSRWCELINDAAAAKDEAAKAKAIRMIVREAIEIVLSEDRLQDQRTRAMMAALKIIQTKVDKGALMEGEGRGNIIIVDGEGRIKEGPVSPESARQKFAMVIGGAQQVSGGGSP
jgi:hypothetical protein